METIFNYIPSLFAGCVLLLIAALPTGLAYQLTERLAPLSKGKDKLFKAWYTSGITALLTVCVAFFILVSSQAIGILGIKNPQILIQIFAIPFFALFVLSVISFLGTGLWLVLRLAIRKPTP